MNNRNLTYAEMLRDPRWQHKRLEVMQRENFKCECCHSKTKTLNVHHGYYEKDKSPWEYDSKTLHCLCEGCHKVAGDLTLGIRKLVALVPVKQLDKVADFLECLAGRVSEVRDMRKSPPALVNGLWDSLLHSPAGKIRIPPEAINGLADIYRLDAQVVIENLDDGSISHNQLMLLREMGTI